MIRPDLSRRFNDGSTGQFYYQCVNGQKILDLTHFKDREGRWTLFGYDALRQRTASIDPLGRVTRFQWCYGGALQDLWDAEARRRIGILGGRTSTRAIACCFRRPRRKSGRNLRDGANQDPKTIRTLIPAAGQNSEETSR